MSTFHLYFYLKPLIWMGMHRKQLPEHAVDILAYAARHDYPDILDIAAPLVVEKEILFLERDFAQITTEHNVELGKRQMYYPSSL